MVEHCSANAEATGSNPDEAPKTFFGLNLRLFKSQAQLRWSHLHFICMSAVHRILICFIIPFMGTMNSINWPAPNIWVFNWTKFSWLTMGSNPVEAPKTFFGLNLRLQHIFISITMTKIDYHEENRAAWNVKMLWSIQYCVLMVAPGNGWRKEWKNISEYYGTLEYFSGVTSVPFYSVTDCSLNLKIKLCYCYNYYLLINSFTSCSI